MNKKNNLILFIIKMILLILLVELISGICTYFFIDLKQAIELGKYGKQFFTEISLAFVIIIVTLISGNSYVFAEKKEGFLKSISKGIPILILASITLFLNLSNIIQNIYELNTINLISLLLFTFAIGLYEEFLFRAWIQNEFIERFNKNRKQIITSIIISSIIFGLMHMTNINTGQSLFITILQIIQATTLGITLGSIYYRTKNIWSVVFLHAFYDFSIFLGEVNLIKDCTLNTTISKDYITYNIIGTLIIIFYFILSSILLLQKSKIYDIKNEQEKTNDKQIAKLIIPGIIILLLSTIIMDLSSNNLEKNFTCYDYKIKSIDRIETHFFNYSDFEINYKKIGPQITNNIETNNYNIYNFKFYLDRDDYLTIENISTNKIIKLKYENIVSYIVFEKEDNYIILINTNNGIEQKVYYSNYINKNNISNSDNYITNIGSSFKQYIVPEINELGYLKDSDTNILYPLLISDTNEYFIIDNDSSLYVLK